MGFGPPPACAYSPHMSGAFPEAVPLIERARAAGFELVEERSIPYGRMYVLEQGAQLRAVLNCYRGKKGFKVVVGGKGKAELERVLGHAPAAPKPASGNALDPFGGGWPRVGADESGKGDFFGPLTVAAFACDDAEAVRLGEMGVMDSKQITPGRIQTLAGALAEIGTSEVRVLMPRDYNPAYAEVGNLNKLLGRLHGECIGALCDRLEAAPESIVVDRYATNLQPLKSAAALASQPRWISESKGERDPAVAAASILARAAFVGGLRELETEFGAKLHPGAGAPTLASARSFVRSFGKDALKDVAKLHFATTQRL